MEFGISRLNSKGMPFKLVTSCSYWVMEGWAPDCNRWREDCNVPAGFNQRLMDFVTNTRGQYRHAAVTSFNYTNPIRPPSPGSGSGIMLHDEPAGISTTSCVGVTDRAKMESILAWFDPDANPTIVIKKG